MTMTPARPFLPTLLQAARQRSVPHRSGTASTSRLISSSSFSSSVATPSPAPSTSSGSASLSSSFATASTSSSPHSDALPPSPSASSTTAPQGPPPTTAETDAAADSAPTSSEPRPVQYSYFVPRVGKTGDSLPVYTDSRNGGTRVLTEIRKVQGNVNALREDLLAHLSLHRLETSPTPSFDHLARAADKRPRAGRKSGPHPGHPTRDIPVQLSKVTAAGKLVIKGNKAREVKAFLVAKGF